MKKFILFLILFVTLLTLPVFASADKPSPAEENYIVSEKDNYIAFDLDTVAGSIDLFRNNLKPIANIALYGMLVLIGVFVVLDIIHKIAL